jgi:hypothetical protein
MLLSSRLTLIRARGPIELLQGGLEAVIGALMEGRLQATILQGEPEGEGVLLGFYQPAPEKPGSPIWRRITGGREARLRSGSWYVAVAFAAESLSEAAGLGEMLEECAGAEAWGATRMGPRELGVGVVEAVTQRPHEALECLRNALTRPGATVEEAPLPGSAYRIARAYREPRWRIYEGARLLPRKAEVSRGSYRVRLGVSVYEGYISVARVDGTFMAAPPNEPFNTMAAIQGLPADTQALTLLEARLAGIAELYGVEPGDFREALRRALGLDYEEGSRGD